jgi:uncharacterized protein
MPLQLPLIPERRAPFDKPFLVLALVGHADYLVTSDRNLLCLTDRFSCPIVTFKEFFVIL